MRAGLTDDYEIVISKVNNKGEPATQPAGEESKTNAANSGRDAKNSNLH